MIGVAVNVTLVPEQMVVALADILTLATKTANVRAVPVPLQLDGVTVTLPYVAPTVTYTELVVPPEVCAHPAGNVQL